MVEYVIRYAGRRINDLADLAICGGSCRVEAGAIGSLTLELPPSHPMARLGAFSKRDATAEVTLSERYESGDEFEMFRGWVTDTSLDADLILTVECEGMLSYLTRTVVRPWSARALTGLSDGTTVINGDPFEWIVEQHNLHGGSEMSFDIGVNPHAPVSSGSDDWKTTWDELNEKFCTGLDRFLHARSEGNRRVIDLLDGGAGEGTQAIVLGENVVEMSLDESSREVVTAIIARGTTDDEYESASGDRIERRDIGLEGADVGQIMGDCSSVVIDGDRAVNWDMVAAYGLKEEQRSYDATTAEDLARAAAADLNPSEIADRDVRAFDVTAIDLHMMNPDIQPIRLLDWTEVFIRADGQMSGDAKGRLIFHGWLPCTSIDFDLADPSSSRYHFGDLPQTLTRQSALRLGMLRRGNGTLVRKAGATEWNNDRTWNRTDQVWDHVDEVGEDIRDEMSSMSDRWSEHLDEQFDAATKEWYEHLESSVGDVAAKDAQGREELLKHLDEVEGKWSDDLSGLDSDLRDLISGEIGDVSGEIGAVSGELGTLRDTVDSNHRTLLDGIRDVAQTARVTFFGTCRDGGSKRTVISSDLTRPGGEEFALVEGVVVDILFQYASSGPLTLNVAATGARSVMTNGFDAGVWQANQVVRLLFDGSYWQACSTDIYGSTITAGNPAQANFHTDGNSLALRIGSEEYLKGAVSGLQVGLTSQSHVDVGSSYVDVRHANGRYVRMRVSETGEPEIVGSSGIYISNGRGSGESTFGALFAFGSGFSGVTGSEVGIGGTSTHDLDFFSTNRISLNNKLLSTRSIVANPGGAASVALSPSQLGVDDAAGYAWSATNGDWRAAGVIVTGTSYNSSTKGIYVHLSQSWSGSVRLNLMGVPVSTVYQQNDPGGPEPPEIFGDESPSDDAEVGSDAAQ